MMASSGNITHDQRSLPTIKHCIYLLPKKDTGGKYEDNNDNGEGLCCDSKATSLNFQTIVRYHYAYEWTEEECINHF